ncbi:MAG: hypothetical protein ABJB03_05980 [Rhodoglobus sp.]
METPVIVDDMGTTRQEVVEREREQFGGIKFGSAFFGWLTATGMAALLTAALAAAGTAFGLGDQATSAGGNSGTITIVGGILLLVILFVAYFSGGYVAGRMARFNGARQGLAVWLWAIVIAVVVALIGLLAGAKFNILANLNTFPRIPINEGNLTVAGIITAVVVAIASLVGALLGGVAGMRYHRRVDRAGLGA